MINRFKTLILLSVLLLALNACIKPYQPDIQQGNIINNSELQELRYGMSKQEVLFILGTPMVSDPFNENRWDYYYSKRDKSKKETSVRLITAIFEGDKLAKLQGDVNLNSISKLEPSVEDKQYGGSVITKPTHREKGIITRVLKRKK